MNLKKWFYLFWTTLLIGGLSSIILGSFLEKGVLWRSGISNVLVGLIWNFGLGATFSIVSQMGFFAYLTIHNVGLGVFRRIWPHVQIVLILFAFFDMVYLRYNLYAQEGEGFWRYILIPLGLLLYAGIVAYFKVKQTNLNAAIPTVFVMFVVTIIEWLPALKQNNISSMFYMLIPLLLCNTWQVMQLHRLTKKSPSEEEPSQQKTLSITGSASVPKKQKRKKNRT